MNQCGKRAFSTCSNLDYRGCTRTFCDEHSGKVNRRAKQCFCVRWCSKDKHQDICSECSSDIISAQRKFFLISFLLSLLIFGVSICILHVALLSVPGFCPKSDPKTEQFSLCTSFQNIWHSLSLYDKQANEKATPDLTKNSLSETSQ